MQASWQVWTTKRGLRALQYGCNIVDHRYDGPAYPSRLEKYASRSFALALPGLIEERVSPELRDTRFIYLKGYDMLLKSASPPTYHGNMMSLWTQHMDTMGAMVSRHVTLEVERTQDRALAGG